MFLTGKGSTLGRLCHNLFKRVKREYGPKNDPNFDRTKKNLMLPNGWINILFYSNKYYVLF